MNKSYESDFGLIKVQSHRLQKADVGAARIDIVESQYWKLAHLIPFKTKDLPQDSLKTASVITGQLTMECRSKDANSCITKIK